jgi:type VI secretion system protein ImpA
VLIDLDDLLRELSPEAPSGENLEYEATSNYGALERAAQGKPEQQFGDTVIPAEEPEWGTVQRLALELFGSTRDLRVAALLTRALTRTAGWPGFRDGLLLIEGLINRFWETVHPQLDPDDDNDPTFRVNTIASLNDAAATLDGLRDAVLVEARGIGRFSLRDLQIANGELPAPKNAETKPPEPQIIAAAFQEADLEQLRAVSKAIDHSLETLAAIEAILLERVGPGASPDLSALAALIKTTQRTVAPFLTDRLASSPAEGEPLAIDGVDPAMEPGGAAGAAAPAAPRAINSREDVVRAIDRICAYYAQQEPSSPIPILLQRAKRLVAKDFLTILQDLAPDGVSQLEQIKGPQTED